ncbi:pyridoxal-dependent decarboxylase [Thiotrichales bacterium 19S3-7]|nr:pyridoxal-dependent decarboxylase [Thiotrichales bacterium 19S3-7]MCF6801096.1 pyridoxal-dependent decarboxylase [Thiotrichales bacterium 19S3-11]
MDNEIEKLKREIDRLKSLIQSQSIAFKDELGEQLAKEPNKIPRYSHPAEEVKNIIENDAVLDFSPQLNTSSYVNVTFEEEEASVALLGLKVNLADQTVYPQSYKIHNTLVNMIAHLWHCPKPDDFKTYGVYAGACTVGSTEACLLAGLALKFRWRKWYAKRNNLKENDVLKERPNIVISTCYQAAWEKLIKYMDIDCKLIQPSYKQFTINPDDIRNAIDDHTIGVIAIMGNHYGGQYDPVWDINDVVEEINKKHSYQVGIHVDAASGGFIAPFQHHLPAWDFRLKNVLSISSSGHKYGESCCGTGWIIWRSRENLSEHVAISVTYLGGKADSYTLNFSRPASGVYVQYYKFLRYGIAGYQKCCDSMMKHAQLIRNGLKAMHFEGKPRFVILDHGNDNCLPVVTAMLNPECNFDYDDIDLQHALSEHHWYVSGYRMGFNNPLTEQNSPLFSDQDASQSMFRVVVKSNISSVMVEHLLDSFRKSLQLLDSIDFKENNDFSSKLLRHKDQVVTNHC